MTYLQSLVEKTRSMILRWRGQNVTFRDLSASHPILNVVATRKECPGNLVIACLEPKYICGPTKWSDADLSLQVTILPSGEERVVLLDEKNGVRVVTESVEVKENVKL